MKKGILGLMTILMVCSCSEKKGERDKSPDKSSNPDCVFRIFRRQPYLCRYYRRTSGDGESKSVFFEVSICQFVNFGRKEIKKLRD